MDINPLVECRALTLGYQGQAVVHLPSACICPGDCIALTGDNGSGKSTLLKTLMGALKPLAGQLQLPQPHQRAYLPQNASLDTGVPMTVKELALTGLWYQTRLLGGYRAQDRQRVDQALQRVGLRAQANQTLDRLSGGQLQRACLARALVQQADLLLLDEPFANIDEPSRDWLTALLVELSRQGHAIVVVLHDQQRADRWFSREWHIQAGKLSSRGQPLPRAEPVHRTQLQHALP